MEKIIYNINSSKDKNIKLLAVGDVMFSRDVENVAIEKGISSFFQDCKEFFDSADIKFCNFESPITEKGEFSKYSRSNFKSNPSIVREVGQYFDVVSLANNHIYDFGLEGAKDTVAHMISGNIKPVGAGFNDKNAHKPAIFEVNDIKVGFIAYTCLPTIDEYQKKYSVAVFNEHRVKQDIEHLNKKVDICIVSLHGGHELISFVEPSFMNKSRFTIDCGADLVIGHHPHVISGIELYKEKPIVYSLGNFIFDNPTIPERKESILLEAILDKVNKVSEISLTPIMINDEYMPKVAKGSDNEIIINKIQKLTSYILIGENNKLYWEAASQGFINNGKENLVSNFSNLGLKGIFVMLKRLRLRHLKLLLLSLKKKFVNK